jgi:hypothetical protein
MRIAFLILICMITSWPAKASWNLNNDYLSKITETEFETNVRFEDLDFSDRPEVTVWLEQMDQALDALPRLAVNLDLKLDHQGKVTALYLLYSEDNDNEELKDFLASLLESSFPLMPEAIDKSTVFNLDCSAMYLERQASVQSKMDLLNQKKQLAENSHIKLLEPEYIDYPRLGELMKFTYADQVFLARIIDVKKDFFDIELELIKDDSLKKVLQDQFYRIERSGKNSHDTCSVVLQSGLNHALSAGIFSAIGSHGLIPGVAALLGMSGTILQERERQESFDLVKGQTIKFKEIKT